MKRIVECDPAVGLIPGDFAHRPAEDDPEDVKRDEFLAFNDEIREALSLVRPLAEVAFRSMPCWAITITTCPGRRP